MCAPFPLPPCCALLQGTHSHPSTPHSYRPLIALTLTTQAWPVAPSPLLPRSPPIFSPIQTVVMGRVLWSAPPCQTQLRPLSLPAPFPHRPRPYIHTAVMQSARMRPGPGIWHWGWPPLQAAAPVGPHLDPQGPSAAVCGRRNPGCWRLRLVGGSVGVQQW